MVANRCCSDRVGLPVDTPTGNLGLSTLAAAYKIAVHRHSLALSRPSFARVDDLDQFCIVLFMRKNTTAHRRTHGITESNQSARLSGRGRMRDIEVK